MVDANWQDRSVGRALGEVYVRASTDMVMVMNNF